MSSCIIRLLDANKIELLDSLSGDYEDSFSLETFHDLCEAFENSPGNEPKRFIIARVQTNDITNPNKVQIIYLGILLVLRCVSAKQGTISNADYL